MSKNPTPKLGTVQTVALSADIVKKTFYQLKDGSWLECDQIAGEVGMHCHEVPADEVPESEKNQKA